MANQIDAKLSGMGDVGRVTDAWVQQLDTEPDIAILIQGVGVGLCGLLERESSKRAVLALACAVLNSQFGPSGYLMSVNDKCYVTHNYIADQSVVNNIKGLLHD